MIKLTMPPNEPIWINSGHIIMLSVAAGKDLTRVTMADGVRANVRETPQEIVDLIRETPLDLRPGPVVPLRQPNLTEEAFVAAIRQGVKAQGCVPDDRIRDLSYDALSEFILASLGGWR